MWNNYGQKADIRLFDMMGKQIQVPTTVSGQEATIDVSGLTKGNYVLMLGGSGYEPRVLVVQ